jgi:hypothetical protein
MNQFTHQLDAALSELGSWRRDIPADDQTSYSTYETIEAALRDAKQISDGERFYDHLASLNRFVCDQAPISESFIPSFKRLFLGLHRHHS